MYDTFEERIRTKEYCWPVLFYTFLQKSPAPCPLIQDDIYSTVDINMDVNVSSVPYVQYIACNQARIFLLS